jgi:hypothetical protein
VAQGRGEAAARARPAWSGDAPHRQPHGDARRADDAAVRRGPRARPPTPGPGRPWAGVQARPVVARNPPLRGDRRAGVARPRRRLLPLRAVADPPAPAHGWAPAPFTARDLVRHPAASARELDRIYAARTTEIGRIGALPGCVDPSKGTNSPKSTRGGDG